MDMPRLRARPVRLDDADVERLLSGRVAPAEARPGYAATAGMVRALASLREPVDASDADAFVHHAVHLDRSDPMIITNRSRTKLAVLVGAATLVLGGVAAAST